MAFQLLLIVPVFVAAVEKSCKLIMTDSTMPPTNVQVVDLLRCPEDNYCCNASVIVSAMFDSFTCSCARNCAAYGDCCWDAVLPYRNYKHPMSRSGCIPVTLAWGPHTYHMITGCATSWPDDDVRESCESARNYSDVFYSVPATSAQGVVYFNGFCALCNYDTNDLVFWNASKSSGTNDTVFYVPDTHFSDGDMNPHRICDDGVTYIDTCKDFSNEDWVRLCEIHYAPVQGVVGTSVVPYKNVFCALCNGEEASNLTCTPLSSWFPVQFGPGTGGPNILELLRPITSRDSCAFWQGNKCYIQSAEHRFRDYASARGDSFVFNASNRIELVSVPYTAQSVLTIVCISISLACLTLKVVVYISFKNARGFSSKSTLCLTCTLMVSQFLFLMANSLHLSYYVCATSAALLHYGFLATFCWTSVLSYDIWKNTVYLSHARRDRSLLRYCAMSWLPPFCVVAIAIAVEVTVPSSSLAPHYGQGSCWMSTYESQAVFFLTPMAILLIIGICLYLHIVVHVRHTVKKASGFEFRSGGERSHMSLYVKLAFIMGATWVLGFVSVFVQSSVTDVVVIVLIGLQGVYLFVGFKDYRYFLACARSPQHSTTCRVTSCPIAEKPGTA
ncbi:uncharacterized protein LOC135398622 [Ornithodoros turicata]|uniref:uncharacterized protein LOC135398622 n=1 Tax=Ornithodoros turicata TaxID=34597 RepID=UPI0031388B11